MLRNAKFCHFVARKAATALYKSFEGFKFQAKVDKLQKFPSRLDFQMRESEGS
jgi:hypothetical protein